MGGAVHLLAGRAVTLTTTATPGDADRIHTPYSKLPEVVKAGDDVLLSDGLLRLSVLRVNGDDVECEILEGGVLRERAGMNLPGTGGKAPALTEKDAADLAFGMQLGVDYVALSFVRRAADVLDLKSRIARAGSQAVVIAKLEKPQAIDDLDAILQAADAVMVARGDLGVELSPEKVPFLQKQIIRRAAAAKKPVITATQMLESMIDHPRPTRAEASDVANAILDGTDAVGRNRDRPKPSSNCAHDGSYCRGSRNPQCRSPTSESQTARHRRPVLLRGCRCCRRCWRCLGYPGPSHHRLHSVGLYWSPDIQTPAAHRALGLYT